MGRQAYLAKIAFGRSAFEPTEQVTESEEYIQIGTSQPEEPLPRRYQEATANNYIQLYDERGNPINPRSHTYGKKLRDAQNDVLASVGVVERRRSPAEELPGSYEERLGELESEETAGNALALASTVVENMCTWWIGTIRDRILTFRIPVAIPYVQIVASERAASGNSIAYTGFTSRLVSTIGIQTLVYWLVPARHLLPYWKSFIPLSPWSPLTPLSIHPDASGSAMGAVRAVVTSPMVLIIAEHFYERWIYSAIFEAVETFIIRPDNADIESPDAISKDRATSILGLHRRSPPLIRNAIHKILVLLGWSESAPSSETERRTLSESIVSEVQNIEIGSAQITSLVPLNVPISRTDRPATDGVNEHVATGPVEDANGLARPATPPTPTASDHDDNDPRIRITSREGIVEMEVRLPARIISSHSEVLDAQPTSARHNEDASQARRRQPASRRHHRVTQLSTEPSQMIGAIVKAQIVGLAVLPFKLVVLRLVASHYFASQTHNGVVPRFVEPFSATSDLSLRTIGIGVSRVALCGALELAIDLGLWGAQYLAVTTVGKRLFGWGHL
ncbi:hypothetical protein N0V95_006227 [Ascochyta clinopodiicola]|nr:hypothetical protein N0V95_006227 [Ascochyta clinopodiicola]